MLELNIDIGRRIVEIRKKILNMDQKALSIALNIKQSKLSKIENNKQTIDIDTLIRLCNLAGLSLNDFLGSANTSGEPMKLEITRLFRNANKLSDSQIALLNEFLESLTE